MSDDLELRAALLRLGTGKKVKKRRKIRATFQHVAAEHKLADAKENEQKTGRCCHCRQTVWLDLFGEQWKANGNPTCPKNPFMIHEVSDDPQSR